LADRLPQPLRDFERAALFDLAQDREQFGWLNLGDWERANFGIHVSLKSRDNLIMVAGGWTARAAKS
jgi:hypothetical protein